MHTVTAKLNKEARQHPNDKGVTFFITLGEQHYNYSTKQKEWTNYDAALFAKDGQIQYYQDVLKAGSIVAVSAESLSIRTDPNGVYEPKIVMNNAKLSFVHNPGTPMPENVREEIQQSLDDQFKGSTPSDFPKAGTDFIDDNIPF